MKRLRGILAISWIGSMMAAAPASVSAYDTDATHQYIIAEAAKVFSFPELDDYLEMVKFGAWHEDEYDHLGWGYEAVMAYIEFPAGYDVGEIQLSTVRLIPQMGWLLVAAPSPTEWGDYDLDGVPDVMVQFSRKDMITALGGSTGEIAVSVVGQLQDTTEFQDSDIVLVTQPPKKK